MTTIKINGMRCGHCSGAVTKALENIEGLADVRVDLEKGEATYTEKRPVPLAVIREAITKIGFEVAG
jgi:copper chaperone